MESSQEGDRVMKVKIEPDCSLPVKKYNTGWYMSILPILDCRWVAEDVGDSIDGYRFNDRDAFLIISIGWLFWSASIFIER
jgi:hypothetical protein